MVLFIGIELHTVLIEAECLAQQPIAAARPRLGDFAIRLVTQAGKTLTIGQQGTEPKLFGLGRSYVKASNLHVVDLELLAVLDLTQDDGVIEGTVNLAGHHQGTHGAQGIGTFVMAIDGERALELSLMNQGRNLANHPNDAHDVVGVAVSEKEMMYALKGDASTMQLTKDAIAAAGIHHHPPSWRL